MTCGIYFINCHGRPYIGQSINIEDRWGHHIALLKRGAHTNRMLQHIWNKHGLNGFKFSVIEECEPERLTDREHHWCIQYDSYRTGCNLKVAKVSNNYKTHLSADVKAKISMRMKDRVDDKRALTEVDVLTIWTRYMNGESCTSIADGYRINNKSIWFIVNRVYYREIELPPSCRCKERRRPGGGRKKKHGQPSAAELFAAAGVPIQIGEGES